MVMVLLQSADGRQVRLGGPLVSELRRLSGATVRVAGEYATSGPETVDVTTYDVLTIDGQAPVVGMVVLRGDEVWLDAEPAVRVLGAQSALSAHAGAKVWVIGSREGDAVRLQSYGIIREPAR